MTTQLSYIQTSIVFDRDVYGFLEQEAERRGMVTAKRGPNISRIANALLRERAAQLVPIPPLEAT